MNHVMINLETLGTQQKAALESLIGMQNKEGI